MDLKDPSQDLQDYNWVSDVEKNKVALMRVFVEREDPTSKERVLYKIKRLCLLGNGRVLVHGLNTLFNKSPLINKVEVKGFKFLEPPLGLEVPERIDAASIHAKLEVDDLMLRRFLVARDLDIEKASAMFLKYLKWRRAAVPNGFISESEVKNQCTEGKLFVQGYDKKGRRIGVLHLAKHSPHKRDLEEFKRFVIYSLDKLCASTPSGQEKFIAIGDIKGWGYSNFDLRGYVACLEIMQEYFPERLGKVFLIHVPYIFWTAWKIIYPFIDKNTREKIVFVENKNLKETLLQDIEESQLPEIYGGKLPLVPIQDSTV